LRILGKVFRIVLLNDKSQILNDRFSIQTQRFGCGVSRAKSWPLGGFAFKTSSLIVWPSPTQDRRQHAIGRKRDAQLYPHPLAATTLAKKA